MPLSANFSADVKRGSVSLTVQFTDLSTFDVTAPIVSWQRDFENDGVIDSPDQNPTHTYTDAGIYSVKLIVSNGADSDTLTGTNYITVLEPALFTRITTGEVANDGGFNRGSSWADFDNDGDLDLFVPGRGTTNFLYKNNGDGIFTKITTGAIATDGGRSIGST